MPETLDDLFATVASDVAARTRPPGAGTVIDTSRRRRAGALAAAAVAVVVGATSFVVLGDSRSGPPEPAPSPTTGIDIDDDVPVWYDDAGLHRGDVVEETAVPLTGALGPDHLVLVRTGALYLGQTTGDVWFHPWAGEPRVVGHGSGNGGPWIGGSDPSGDYAAWFDEEQLVVYDTASGREVFRADSSPATEFVDVSPDRVVWRPAGPSGTALLALDLAAGTIDAVPHSERDVRDPDRPAVIDLRGEVEAWAWGESETSFCCGPARSGGIIMRGSEHSRRYPAFVSPMASISPDGRFVGGATGDEDRADDGGISGTGFIEVSSGAFFELPGGRPHGQGTSWAYGSTAMVPTLTGGDGGQRSLFACDVARRECEPVPAQGEVILPG